MDEDFSNLFASAPTSAVLPPVATIPDWTPPIDPASPALKGLAPDIHRAITGTAKGEQVRALLNRLTDTRRYADDLCDDLQQYAWFRGKGKRGTQLRLLRKLCKAAQKAGFPVCTDNEGYWLGDADDLRAAGKRKRAHGLGALADADMLFKLADDMDRKAGKRP